MVFWLKRQKVLMFEVLLWKIYCLPLSQKVVTTRPSKAAVSDALEADVKASRSASFFVWVLPGRIGLYQVHCFLVRFSNILKSFLKLPLPLGFSSYGPGYKNTSHFCLIVLCAMTFILEVYVKHFLIKWTRLHLVRSDMKGNPVLFLL